MNRERELAGLVADGATVSEAGERLGLTKGQASRTWKNVKKSLGWQAR